MYSIYITRLPWLTSNIVRNKMQLFWQKTKVPLFSPSIMNKVVDMLRNAKKNFLMSIKPSNTQFWKIVKINNNDIWSLNCLMRMHGANTDNEKADMLNDLFSKCWNCFTRLLTLSKDLIHQNQMNLMAYLLKMLKPIAETIAPSLTHLFNIQGSMHHFPMERCQSYKSCPSGYRLIYSFCPSCLTSWKTFFLLIIWKGSSALSEVFRKETYFMISCCVVCHSGLAIASWEQSWGICCVFFDIKKA